MVGMQQILRLGAWRTTAAGLVIALLLTASAMAAPASSTKSAPAALPSTTVAMTARKVLLVKGTAKWDSAFDSILTSLKDLNATLAKQGMKPAGNLTIVYTSTDDTGFTYLAEVSVDRDIPNLSSPFSMGSSPSGPALKFVHHGSYDNMDNTYEAITNHLDNAKLEAQDTFVEEYVTSPIATDPEKLEINVFVPLKNVPQGMAAYGKVCGWTLARAHARSGDRIAIASYLGNSDSFDRAILQFSEAYADQNERDYKALAKAVKSGRITAETGL